MGPEAARWRRRSMLACLSGERCRSSGLGPSRLDGLCGGLGGHVVEDAGPVGPPYLAGEMVKLGRSRCRYGARQLVDKHSGSAFRAFRAVNPTKGGRFQAKLRHTPKCACIDSVFGEYQDCHVAEIFPRFAGDTGPPSTAGFVFLDQLFSIAGTRRRICLNRCDLRRFVKPNARAPGQCSWRATPRYHQKLLPASGMAASSVPRARVYSGPRPPLPSATLAYLLPHAAGAPTRSPAGTSSAMPTGRRSPTSTRKRTRPRRGRRRCGADTHAR
jgi:hypothetical protein